MGLMTAFKSKQLEHISVKDKINYLFRLTQFLAISAIFFGIVGMLLSNLSIRSLDHHALQPLGHLRLIKESYQQKVLFTAQDIAQGKITDYGHTYQELILEKEKILYEWDAYKRGHLTQAEKELLPNTEKYMKLSIKSMDTLIELVREKKLMDIISWTTDDAQYTIIELIPILNNLMQIQIINAQDIYSTTQIQFFVILLIILCISIMGIAYISKMLKRVIDDITQATSELLVQSRALTSQKLDKPFIWTRTDEIGEVGKSFELSRQALHASFQAIEAKNKELVQKSKLAQMGEMISMIAHQWRQPLGAIASTTVNMKIKLEMESFDLDTQEGRDEQNRYFIQRLDKIEEYVASLTTTIDDFRNFHRPDKQLVSCSFKDVVQKGLNIIRDSMEVNNIEIIEEYSDEMNLEMNDNEITQVILNLLKNAQDNFKEKWILKPIVRIKVEKYSLMICDNGGGIPEDIIDKIFDPYFSTKDEKNGTGLGLHMSRVIIEEHHGGKLRVKNHQDGVCFEIKLGSEE